VCLNLDRGVATVGRWETTPSIFGPPSHRAYLCRCISLSRIARLMRQQIWADMCQHDDAFVRSTKRSICRSHSNPLCSACAFRLQVIAFLIKNWVIEAVKRISRGPRIATPRSLLSITTANAADIAERKALTVCWVLFPPKLSAAIGRCSVPRWRRRGCGDQ
jgi:hypothetical protein